MSIHRKRAMIFIMVVRREIDAIKSLQNIYSSVSSQCDNSFKIFEKYKPELSSVAETQKTEVWPSISQMLQWLKELEKAFENECLVREFVLENMDLHEPSTTENLIKIWQDYSKLRMLVNDVMAFVSYFIQADLTKIS
ncbi:AFG2-interacting ribosome maturation factor-like isoform X2 [Tachypleus tridentatus]|uniref:AFG2-interacting ribosome maturation factor-like isoform X2 n=1 Tax=Tachypleus tridentatus TaxID=6853 RepID=UPI003FD160BA